MWVKLSVGRRLGATACGLEVRINVGGCALLYLLCFFLSCIFLGFIAGKQVFNT